ncbi:putative glycerophosphoryl diester phosphodiesterase 1 [Corynebacterium glaucum]|uniref:glycerophosphodiester phosphodiesterase n=1 Tax=Corynebacterium glaucum TaxID=187491 RepID=UPI0025B50F22|nr:glycerophosphodiester phosphodiesterase family protein [Corynebacterium glaucum]WJZ08766.1 putative glycerophosphoryl diester phosphodiesterase 1 [Corynebacterium glaucum]
MSTPTTTGIIAHRGLNGIYPENTRRSFEEALKLDGVAGIECDVNLTADGQVVVIHDQTVDRTSDGSGEVAEMGVDKLKELNFGTQSDPQELLLLDELLDLLDAHPGKMILIETKHPSPFGDRLEQAVADVLRARGMDSDERVQLISFNPEAIERFEELLPELQSFLLLDPEPLLTGKGGAPFERIGTCGVGPSMRQAKAEPELLGGDVPSYVWTVNLPKDMLWLRERGASLIGTDLPHIAVEVFEGTHFPQGTNV